MNFKPTPLKIIISILIGILLGIVFVETLNVFLMDGETEDVTSIMSIFFWIFVFVLLIYLFLSLITKKKENTDFITSTGNYSLPQINVQTTPVTPGGDKWWMNV